MIVLHEFPRSGGTWVATLIGDAIGYAKRDLYVGRSPFMLDLEDHPWYPDQNHELAADCVVKSHELPGSVLIPDGAVHLHLVRDVRDVVVSSWRLHRLYIKNGFVQEDGRSFTDFVLEQGAAWSAFVDAWFDHLGKWYRYEDFLAAPSATLQSLLNDIDIPAESDSIEEAVSANTLAQSRKAYARLFRVGNPVGPGGSGKWTALLRKDIVNKLEQKVGSSLQRLGYRCASDLDAGVGD